MCKNGFQELLLGLHLCVSTLYLPHIIACDQLSQAFSLHIQELDWLFH